MAGRWPAVARDPTRDIPGLGSPVPDQAGCCRRLGVPALLRAGARRRGQILPCFLEGPARASVLGRHLRHRHRVVVVVPFSILVRNNDGATGAMGQLVSSPPYSSSRRKRGLQEKEERYWATRVATRPTATPATVAMTAVPALGSSSCPIPAGTSITSRVCSYRCSKIGVRECSTLFRDAGPDQVPA